MHVDFGSATRVLNHTHREIYLKYTFFYGVWFKVTVLLHATVHIEIDVHTRRPSDVLNVFFKGPLQSWFIVLTALTECTWFVQNARHLNMP